jgi:hypothetical protein
MLLEIDLGMPTLALIKKGLLSVLNGASWAYREISVIRRNNIKRMYLKAYKTPLKIRNSLDNETEIK